MNHEKWFLSKLSKYENKSSYIAEELLLQVTEKIVELLIQKKMTRTELSAKMKVSKPYITKILNGNENLTLKTLVNIAHALDTKICIQFEKNNHETLFNNNYHEIKNIDGKNQISENYDRNPFPIAA